MAGLAACRRGMEDAATLVACPQRIGEAAEEAAASGCGRRVSGAVAAQCGNDDAARSGG